MKAPAGAARREILERAVRRIDEQLAELEWSVEMRVWLGELRRRHEAEMKELAMKPES